MIVLLRFVGVSGGRTYWVRIVDEALLRRSLVLPDSVTVHRILVLLL